MNPRNALNFGKQCLLLRMGAQGKRLSCALLLASDKEALEPHSLTSSALERYLFVLCNVST